MIRILQVLILQSTHVVPPIIWCPWAIAPLSPLDNPALVVGCFTQLLVVLGLVLWLRLGLGCDN